MNAVTWARAQRAVAARRRIVAAAFAGLAVLFGLSALHPAAPRHVLVLAAAHDLVAGSALAAADVRTVALPPAAVPFGALRPGAAVAGRVVAGPVRRGEPLTDVRLAGPALLAAVGPPGAVAVPVRFADPGAAALLRPGDHVDVLAATDDPTAPTDATAGTLPGNSALPGHSPPTGGTAPPGGTSAPGGTSPSGGARVVAADVVVLLVTPPQGATSLGDGTLVVVACTPPVARALAAAATTARLSPALRAPPGGSAPGGVP